MISKTKFYYYIAFIAVLGVLAIFATGLVARAYWHHPEAYLQARTAIVAEQIGQVAAEGEPFAIVIGNSLVERNFVTKLCDLPVINAGVGRSRARDLLEIARIARAGQAEIRVLSIGVNDAGAGTSAAQFAVDYAELYSILEPTHVVGVTGTRRAEYNAIIRQIGKTAHYVEPLDSDLLQPDGVHYTMMGAKEWKSRLEQDCPVSG